MRHLVSRSLRSINFYLFFAIYIAAPVASLLRLHGGLSLRALGLPWADKFGIVIFRWAILASVIVSFSTINFSHRGVLLIQRCPRPDAKSNRGKAYDYEAKIAQRKITMPNFISPGKAESAERKTSMQTKKRSTALAI